MEYYVTVEGDRVAGPFADRAAARKRAAEMNTFEVALTYLVEAIDPAKRESNGPENRRPRGP